MSETNLWEGMTVCDEHMGGEGDDCEKCWAENAEAMKRLGQLQQSIQDRLKGLAQQGVTMPDTVRHEIQLQVLLDMFIPTPRQGSIYQGEVMGRMLTAIKNMQEQVKQPSLHVAPANVDLSQFRKRG